MNFFRKYSRKSAAAKAAVLLTAVCGCIFSACGTNSSDHYTGNPEQTDDGSDRKSGSDVPDISSDSNSDELVSLIQHTGLFSRFCSTDEGFYYLTEKQTELSDGSYASHLMYMDYATCQEVYLCSDSSCRHDTQACTSVFSDASYDGRIFLWDGFLYYLDRSPDTSGTTVITITGETETETGPSVLYRMNPDGSGREQIYTFDDNATVEDVAFGGPGGLYFVTKKLGTAQISSGTYTTASDRKLICLDPGSRETRAVCPLDFDDGLNWQIIGCAGNRIILETYQYPDGMTEQDAAALDEDSYMDILKKTKLVYASLDLSGGEKTVICTRSGSNSSSECILNGFLYISDDSGKDIVKIDPLTGEESVIASLSRNDLSGTLGSLLCCTSYNTAEDPCYSFIDTDTGKVYDCSLTNKALGWPLDLMAAADGRALVIYDYEYTDNGDGSYEISRYQYGLIRLEDLLNSVPDYTPVKMIREGI